jgi:beta-lactamase class A
VTGGGRSPLARAIGRAFAGAQVDGWLHVADIDGDGEVDVGADTPVALASVFKVPLLVALHRLADAGALRLGDRVVVAAGDRTAGITGLGAMVDDAELSLRDLALLMITVSDNAAADAVLGRVGFDAIARALDELGLERTVVEASCRDQHDALATDLARCGMTLPEALADASALSTFRVLDPATANRSTPREMTRLLAAIWRDEAASPAACREMRRVLRLQVWPHRLASGFPSDDVRVAGKTGTLAPLRSEVGVVEYPDGRRYAAAVFTRSSGRSLTDPRADAVIGTAARLAIDHLRGAPSG